jgi:hypothetical protein
MAQSTAGIKLYFGDSADGGTTIPASWTELPDITGTPSMNASPAKLDSTNLAELVQKTYVNGLMDLGGSFEFPANMTPGLVSAAATASTAAVAPASRCFMIDFPAPLNTGYWWQGELAALAPGENSVDAVVTTTLYISQETALTPFDSTAIS